MKPLSEKPKILIADDEAVNRDALRSILGDEYELLEAADGGETIRLLTEHEKEIEAIILDLLMPRMDGWAFLEQYGKAAQWKDIPVIAASGDERSRTEHRCLELGAWDYIRKPFDPTTVYFRLKNNISRRHVHLLEKQKITDVFQRYVDPSILAELLRSDITEAELRGKTAEIAVLFVDIRGFTSLSEKLPPEDVVELLNLYLTLTSSAVKQHGGTLDKFIGDCTMAFWGAPLPCEDKVYRACEAAVYMAERARSFSEMTRTHYGMEVSFGIGIHVGPAIVGNIGAKDRLDYTAIGDTVNTASRLEAVAPAGGIYISRAVADALGSRARVTSLGKEIRLKGKQSGFELLTLDELYAGR